MNNRSIPFFLTLFILFSHNAYADTYHSSGWTVTAGTYNDTHIVDGIVNISGAAIIDGDLIVDNGEVASGGSALIVHGDLIVTNSRIDFSTGSASLAVDGDIICDDGIEVRVNLSAANIIAGNSIYSPFGEIVVPGNIHCGRTLRAFNKKIDVGGDVVLSGTIGGGSVVLCADNDNAYIGGNLIISSPDNVAYIGVYNGDLKVQGDVKTSAPTNTAYIDVGYDIFAGSISTYGFTDAYVKSENGQIIVSEDILTHSITTTACVWADGDIIAHDISTYSGATSGLDKNVSVSSDTGEIKVAGDIITKGGGGAASVYGYNGLNVAGNVITDGSGCSRVYCENGSIDVSGAIKTSSSGSNAFVYALSALNAGDIVTSGYSDAYVGAYNLALTVQRDIKTYSQTAQAEVYGENIESTDIVTDGYTSGDVKRRSDGYIHVIGDITTHSANGSAYICCNDILANNITTSAGNGWGDISVNPGSIIVTGDICLNATGLKCKVQASYDIKANNIVTNCASNGSATVQSITGYLDVKNNITTNSLSGDAWVLAHGYLKANNITTYGWASALVESNCEINVSGDISTHSSIWYAYVKGANGVKAKNIVTNGVGDSYVSATNYPIVVTNDIKTYSSSNEAYVYGRNISARNITTDGYDNSQIESYASGSYPGYIDVSGIISSRSSNAKAYVHCDSYLSAKNVKTSSGGSQAAYVLSVNDYIDVPGGINTYSPLSSAYVKSNENISTNRIVTKAASGQDCSIRSETGSVKFTCTLSDLSNSFTMIENAHVIIEEDITLNKALDCKGTCTINMGDGTLTFDASGQLDVTSGSTLIIQNTRLVGLDGTNLICKDDSSTIWLRDCELVLDDTFILSAGSFIFEGDVIVSGQQTLAYTSSQASYIYPNSKLYFDYGTTFNYDTVVDSRFSMLAGTSKIHLNNATVNAAEDLRFEKGVLVFDNSVTFSAEAGKEIALGDGASAANNVSLDFYDNGKLRFYGTLSNDNQ